MTSSRPLQILSLLIRAVLCISSILAVEISNDTCEYVKLLNGGCFKYGVVFEENEPKCRLLEGGCWYNNERCLLVGDRVIEGCDIHECQIKGTCYSMAKIASGCNSVNLGCQLLHSFWHDQCNVYQCVPTDQGSSIQFHHHEVMLWPRGYYGFLKHKKGCPIVMEETWYEGRRIHFSEGGNYYSGSYSMAGTHTETILEHQFCLHDDKLRPGFKPVYQTYWDAGRYCILRFNGTCPRNFTEGYVRMIDFNGKITVQNVEIDVKGIVDGILPDGEFNDKSTLLQFCCRFDGDIDEPLILPSGRDFVLFMAENETKCQNVRAMSSEIQFFSFADDGEGYKRELVGALPRITTSDNNTLIYFCHYKPLECGCVHVNGESVSNGFTTNSGCVSYKCVFSEMTQKYETILNSLECYYDGRCIAEGDSVKIHLDESCYDRTCVKKTDLNKKSFQDSWHFEDIPSGCSYNNTCYNASQRFTASCLEYECQKTNGIYQLKLIGKECRTVEGACIEPGSPTVFNTTEYPTTNSYSINCRCIAGGNYACATSIQT